MLRQFVFIGGLVLASGCISDEAAQEISDRHRSYSCTEMLELDLKGVDVASIDKALLPERTRVIPPDTAVTMDYLPDRVNLEVDRNGIITRVYCG